MKRLDQTDEDVDLERLDQQLEDGRITREEHAKESKAIRRFYRDLALGRAEDAAREAYDRELERW